MRFWDACALTPLFVTEARSTDLRDLELSDPEIQVWWGSRVEVTSAIYKKVRGGVISPSEGSRAATEVESKFDTRYTPVEPSRPIPLRATSLAKSMIWALQLAAFWRVGCAGSSSPSTDVYATRHSQRARRSLPKWGVADHGAAGTNIP